MSAALILMSRAPAAGQTKTRLESHLKAEECAQLHKAFLKDINAKLLNLKDQHPDLKLYLSYTPKEKKYLFEGIIAEEFIRIAQRGENLGEIMYNALSDVYQQDNSPLIITGSDLPLLDIDIFSEALKKLKDYDLVIGPSQDGGYYLLALNQVNKFLFDFQNWGNDSVLARTVKEAEKNDLSSHFLKEASDIDYYQELLELNEKLKAKKKDLNFPRNTEECLKKLL